MRWSLAALIGNYLRPNLPIGLNSPVLDSLDEKFAYGHQGSRGSRGSLVFRKHAGNDPSART
jgi:hypothetical protein